MAETESALISLANKGLREYWARAPFPLAFERSWECRILAQQTFRRPILDLGCGEGLFAWMLFQDPVDTGIDPNPRELQRARQLGRYKELIQCTGDSIPKPDGSYQTIFSNSVLEHIPDLKPVIRELHRLLSAGGTLYVTVPSHQFEQYSVVNQLLQSVGLSELSTRYRAFFNRFWHHHHCYKPEAWQKLFREGGFDVQQCHSYGPRSLCVLNDFLVPFALPSILVKKIFNCWTLMPGLRKLLLTPSAALAEKMASNAMNVANGGLVFLTLRKPH